MVNSKPAGLVVERQCVRPTKDSGIVNDANDWAIETMQQPALSAGTVPARDHRGPGDDEDRASAGHPAAPPLRVWIRPRELTAEGSEQPVRRPTAHKQRVGAEPLYENSSYTNQLNQNGPSRRKPWRIRSAQVSRVVARSLPRHAAREPDPVEPGLPRSSMLMAV